MLHQRGREKLERSFPVWSRWFVLNWLNNARLMMVTGDDDDADVCFKAQGN